MTALAGVELESLVSEPDALTTRPPVVVDTIQSKIKMYYILLSPV